MCVAASRAGAWALADLTALPFPASLSSNRPCPNFGGSKIPGAGVHSSPCSTFGTPHLRHSCHCFALPRPPDGCPFRRTFWRRSPSHGENSADFSHSITCGPLLSNFVPAWPSPCSGSSLRPPVPRLVFPSSLDDGTHCSCIVHPRVGAESSHRWCWLHSHTIPRSAPPGCRPNSNPMVSYLPHVSMYLSSPGVVYLPPLCVFPLSHGSASLRLPVPVTAALPTACSFRRSCTLCASAAISANGDVAAPCH